MDTFSNSLCLKLKFSLKSNKISGGSDDSGLLSYISNNLGVVRKALSLENR